MCQEGWAGEEEEFESDTEKFEGEDEEAGEADGEEVEGGSVCLRVKTITASPTTQAAAVTAIAH